MSMVVFLFQNVIAGGSTTKAEGGCLDSFFRCRINPDPNISRGFMSEELVSCQYGGSPWSPSSFLLQDWFGWFLEKRFWKTQLFALEFDEKLNATLITVKYEATASSWVS